MNNSVSSPDVFDTTEQMNVEIESENDFESTVCKDIFDHLEENVAMSESIWKNSTYNTENRKKRKHPDSKLNNEDSAIYEMVSYTGHGELSLEQKLYKKRKIDEQDFETQQNENKYERGQVNKRKEAVLWKDRTSDVMKANLNMPKEVSSVLSLLPPPVERCIPVSCYECNSDNLIEDMAQGEITCKECGTVNKCHLTSVESEWRVFNDDSGPDPSRVDNVYDPLFANSFKTNIGNKAYGRKEAIGNASSFMLYLHKKNQHSEEDKLLLDVCSRIDKFTNRIRVSGSVVKRAKEIFKKYYDYIKNEGQDIRSSEREEIVVASVFIGCELERIVRTLKEFCSASRLTKKKLSSVIRKLKVALPSEYVQEKISPGEYASYFSQVIDMSISLRAVVHELAEKLSQVEEVSGKSPTTIAATSLHIVCLLAGDPISRKQHQIPEITGVAQVTIAKAIKALSKEKLKIILPKETPNIEDYYLYF